MYNKIKRSFSERVFDVLNITLLTLLMIATIYPFLYVIFASFSDAPSLIKHRGLLVQPLNFSTEAYKAVFRKPDVLTGYLNTIIYVVFGTVISVLLTTFAAYALSRNNVLFRDTIMKIITFTMFFGGGLIPKYLLVKNLGMLNTRWAIMIPVAIKTYNLIVMRTAFQSIPTSLEESAKMDGATDFIVLFKIILPLSLPVISVMVLFYGVNMWNEWFDPMIYLTDRSLFPLQLILREILVQNQTEEMTGAVGSSAAIPLRETVKHATTVVATVPILCIYPFLQKYFVKGMMIGSIKG